MMPVRSITTVMREQMLYERGFPGLARTSDDHGGTYLMRP
jgi:hypothetical protein